MGTTSPKRGPLKEIVFSALLVAAWRSRGGFGRSGLLARARRRPLGLVGNASNVHPSSLPLYAELDQLSESIRDLYERNTYNMLLYSLPIDQRGRGDFGEYLRADEQP